MKTALLTSAFRLSTCFTLAIAGAIGAQGCAAQADDTASAGAEADTQGENLYASGSVLWKKRTLSVCWDNAHTNDAEENAGRAWAQSAVTASWQRYSALTFTGWGLCTSAGADIRITPADVRSGSGVGVAPNGGPTYMTLNVTYRDWGNRCSCSPQGRTREVAIRSEHPAWTDAQVYAQCRLEFSGEGCTRSTAVHEFGHALGFQHEQDRADHPGDCPSDAGWVNGGDDVYVGAWDNASVMSYCNPVYNADGKLSRSDIDGVRQLYGQRSDVPIVGDFDGTKPADVTIWRPQNGQWWWKPAGQAQGYLLSTYGQLGDIPVRGDYDGDGKADFALFRPQTGQWFIRTGTGATLANGIVYGLEGDIPVPGDYDGDGKADLALFRPSTGEWFARKVSGASILYADTVYGVRGDVPVPGDYDGDGKADLALFRPSSGEWFARKGSGAAILYAGTVWGGPGDIATFGDYDGDGKSDLAIYRPSDGTLYALSATGTVLASVTGGSAEDVPVPADYDGDGKTDVGLFHPSTAGWTAKRANGSLIFSTTWGNPQLPEHAP